MYSVTCMELGEQTLSIVVGNGPSLKNMFPAHAEATSRSIQPACIVILESRVGGVYYIEVTCVLYRD